jgi:hypothetical protein
MPLPIAKFRLSIVLLMNDAQKPKIGIWQSLDPTLPRYGTDCFATVLSDARVGSDATALRY